MCDVITESECAAYGILHWQILKVPDDVIVENVHLLESLMTLSYLLNENNEYNDDQDEE